MTPDDLVLMACDGLWDFLKKGIPQLIEDVIRPYWNRKELAQKIVDYALTKCMSTDNVSVLLAWAKYQEDSSLESLSSFPSTQSFGEHK
jgi:serine/threonine protein phosphatase PrpC